MNIYFSNLIRGLNHLIVSYLKNELFRVTFTVFWVEVAEFTCNKCKQSRWKENADFVDNGEASSKKRLREWAYYFLWNIYIRIQRNLSSR